MFNVEHECDDTVDHEQEWKQKATRVDRQIKIVFKKPFLTTIKIVHHVKKLEMRIELHSSTITGWIHLKY